MSGFSDWYALYPIKKGRVKAAQSWEKQGLDSRVVELIEILEDQKKHDAQWKVGIGIPHPTTYLNQQRWEDEVLHETDKQNNRQSTCGAALDNILKFATTGS